MGYMWPDKNSPRCPELVTLPWAPGELARSPVAVVSGEGFGRLRCAAQHSDTQVLTILSERREELCNRELTWLAQIRR